MQAEALGGEVFADHRHGEVGAAPPSDGFGQAVAEVAGAVGSAPHLPQQRLPLRTGQPVVVPVGARVLTPVVEVLLVVGL